MNSSLDEFRAANNAEFEDSNNNRDNNNDSFITNTGYHKSQVYGSEFTRSQKQRVTYDPWKLKHFCHVSEIRKNTKRATSEFVEDSRISWDHDWELTSIYHANAWAELKSIFTLRGNAIGPKILLEDVFSKINSLTLGVGKQNLSSMFVREKSHYAIVKVNSLETSASNDFIEMVVSELHFDNTWTFQYMLPRFILAGKFLPRVLEHCCSKDDILLISPVARKYDGYKNYILLNSKNGQRKPLQIVKISPIKAETQVYLTEKVFCSSSKNFPIWTHYTTAKGKFTVSKTRPLRYYGNTPLIIREEKEVCAVYASLWKKYKYHTAVPENPRFDIKARKFVLPARSSSGFVRVTPNVVSGSWTKTLHKSHNVKVVFILLGVVILLLVGVLGYDIISKLGSVELEAVFVEYCF